LREQIQLLEQLQEIDDQIDRWERDLARLPLETQDLARSLVSIRREVTQARERQAELETTQKKNEKDLAAEQEKIKRSERRLLNIKNEKEYNALSKEIKLGKKVVAEIEEAVLAAMSEIEALKTSLERRDKEYEELEKELLSKKSEIESTASQAEVALVTLNEEKARLTESVEMDLLKRYQIVRKARGNALAELTNGSCTGCHMTIPAQLVISVLKQEEMVICPSCHRVLFVRPENIPEFNKLET
jgi:predicted  nucleic acid-binding Zn-ribbon protein